MKVTKSARYANRKNGEGATVESLGIDQCEMAERWEAIHDLLGGTRRMRECRTRWLPKEARESKRDYEDRLARSFLYEALGDTIDKVSAKPFEKPMSVDEEMLPPALRGLVRNADSSGTSLGEFARAQFRDGVKHGLTHILVDAPSNPERRVSVAPYFEQVCGDQIIAARFEYDSERGERVLAYLRYSFERRAQVDEFGEQLVQHIKEWTRSQWRLWTRLGDGEWRAGEWTDHSYMSARGGGIPLVTAYFEREDEMLARVPFAKLAELNVEHWQKASDHTNLGRFAAVGVLFLKGFETHDKEGNAKDFTWGPRNTLVSENPNAEARIVEHTGTALRTLGDELLRIEERMEVLGLEPYMRKTGSETATGKAMHVGKTDSAIHGWIGATEQALRSAFVVAAQWLGRESGGSLSLEIPDDWRPRLFSDFKVPVLRGVDDSVHLLTMRREREISHETFIAEAKRRGTLSDDVDAEWEREQLEAEEPQLPMDPPADDADEGDEEDLEGEQLEPVTVGARRREQLEGGA